MTANEVLDCGGCERKGSGRAEVLTGGRVLVLDGTRRLRMLLIQGGVELTFLAERESCALAALLPPIALSACVVIPERLLLAPKYGWASWCRASVEGLT